jgi:hypothetical protein
MSNSDDPDNRREKVGGGRSNGAMIELGLAIIAFKTRFNKKGGGPKNSVQNAQWSSPTRGDSKISLNTGR